MLFPLWIRIEETIPKNSEPRAEKGREEEHHKKKEKDPLVAFHETKLKGANGVQARCRAKRGEHSVRIPSQRFRYKLSCQTVEKGPSVSLRSIASLQRTAYVRLRSSISRAPRTWNLFDRSGNRVFNALFPFDHYSLTCSEPLGYALEDSTPPSEENDSGRKNGGSW